MTRALTTVRIGRRRPPEYEMTWRAKWTCDGATTIAEMATQLREAAAELDEMAKEGLELRGEVGDDYAFITTKDAELAKKWQMQEIEWEDDLDEEEDKAEA